MKQINIYMIFNNLKQQDLLVIAFILVKLKWMDQTSLLDNIADFSKNLYQDQKNIRIKNNILLIFIKVEN